MCKLQVTMRKSTREFPFHGLFFTLNQVLVANQAWLEFSMTDLSKHHCVTIIIFRCPSIPVFLLQPFQFALD